MTTGHTSKAALGAARIALLAGVSAAALSLSMTAAHADGLTYNDNTGAPTASFGWNGLTYTNIDSATFVNSTGFTTSVGSAGLTTSGFVTVTYGTSNQTLDGATLTSYSGGTGNSSYLSGDSLTMSNGTGSTISLNSGDGSASFASGAATIDGAGNIATAGSVKSGTGINTTTINGNQTIVTGAAGSTYGLAVIGNTDAPGVVGVGVTGNQIGVVVANANGTATMGSTAGGTPGFRATNAAGTAGAGMNSDGIAVFNATGSQFVAKTDGTISAEGNRIQNVGTPIVGTDATNKAYVDKGLNKAYEGTAIALAISQPVFLPGQTFAVRGGWGDYEGQNAFGVSAAGVIAHNTFGYGSTVSLDAGIGAGSSSVAGKAGVTVGFGGGSAPLK